jgi:hypothetical protein
MDIQEFINCTYHIINIHVLFILYILKIIPLTRKIKQKTNRYKTEDYWGSLVGPLVEPITDTKKNTKKWLEENNIRDWNSKLKDQNIIIKPNWFTQLILNIPSNWLNLTDLINPYYWVNWSTKMNNHSTTTISQLVGQQHWANRSVGSDQPVD